MDFTASPQGPSLRRLRKKDSEESCSVSGCTEPAIRSMSLKKVQSAISSVSAPGRRAHLCKAHYKEFKKKTKEDRDSERWGW